MGIAWVHKHGYSETEAAPNDSMLALHSPVFTRPTKGLLTYSLLRPSQHAPQVRARAHLHNFEVASGTPMAPAIWRATRELLLHWLRALAQRVRCAASLRTPHAHATQLVHCESMPVAAASAESRRSGDVVRCCVPPRICFRCCCRWHRVQAFIKPRTCACALVLPFTPAALSRTNLHTSFHA